MRLSSGKPKRVCVFDVNETLLDLSALDAAFERTLGSAALRTSWFGELIRSAMVTIITNRYAEFVTVARGALTVIAGQSRIELLPEDADALLEAMQQLPAHADAEAALADLRGSGFRVAALTNSTERVAVAQLTYAGIVDQFEMILSADSARRLKPAPEPYRLAAHRLAVAPDAMRLIAAHSWDIAGALNAGCAAAYVGRNHAPLDPLVPVPDIVAPDLKAVADAIISMEA